MKLSLYRGLFSQINIVIVFLLHTSSWGYENVRNSAEDPFGVRTFEKRSGEEREILGLQVGRISSK